MIIALDIGCTKIATALINGTEVKERREIASVIHSDLSLLIPTIIDLCQDWIEKKHDVGDGQCRENIEGIGIACTGLVSDSGVHFLSAGADKFLPLQAQLIREFDLPLVMLNDASAAAWGEYYLGSHFDAKSEGSQTLVYITVSSGIGGGIIQNGHLVTSHQGFAAHLGHLTVSRLHPESEDILCVCGRKNCVEAIASGTAIGHRASQLFGRELSCRDAFSFIEQCPQMAALLDECAHATAELIANVRAVTGTNIVVLGGSVGLTSQFKNRVEKALQSLPPVYSVKLLSPALGRDSDLLGAALIIKNQLKNNSFS